jgi:hypothetical protein
MTICKVFFALIFTQVLCLTAASTVFCQSDTLDIIRFTPPPGWTKTDKDGAVVFSDVNKTTGAFCVLTVYSSTASAGDAGKDFASKWNDLVVKPFNATLGTKTETQTDPQGWQITAGAAPVETEGGLKAYAVLTVFSGFGRAASVLALLNDETYLAKVSHLVSSIKLEKSPVSSAPARAIPDASLQRDPFPDRPGYAPQKPLAGSPKDSITMADLVGTWNQGGSSVVTYIDSARGNYAGTNTTFYAESYTIRADGSFDYRFTGRTSNQTVRETDTGSIVLSGGTVFVKFNGRSSHKYQFISFMTLSNGGAVLSLLPLGNKEDLYDANWMALECGHGSGYIHCVGGEEWVLRLKR